MFALGKLGKLFFMAFGADMFAGQDCQISIVGFLVFAAVAISTGNVFCRVLAGSPVSHLSRGYLFMTGDTGVFRSLLSPATCCLINPDKEKTVEKAFQLTKDLSTHLRNQYKLL